MDRNEYVRAIMDTLAALDELERVKKEWLKEWRRKVKQFREDLDRYRKKVEELERD